MRIPKPTLRWRRRAFSLIELLVSIGILSALIAFLLPAVQKAREIASRANCANNLKQIGLALQQFHTLHNVYPSNGGWDGKQTILTATNTPFSPSTFDFTTNQTYTWGVGDPKWKPTDQTGSWAYSILPNVEQDLIYRQMDYPGVVPVYVCPSRRPPKAEEVIPQDNYGKYNGGGWTWGKLDYAVSAFSFEIRPYCRAGNTFTDGLSNTILVGEKAFNPMLAPTWYWDEPFFLGGSMGSCRDGLALLRDIPTDSYMANPFKNNWGSNHPSGVNFLFGDGSVRHLDRSIDDIFLTSLMTPDGGEAVSPP